jgi:aminoglycoside 2'-N-acetyltransferase I
VTIARTVHTADLTGAERAAIRTLLDRAFEGRFQDSNWEHALGGLHVVLLDGDAVVAHAAVVRRQLVYEDRAVRTGYVEAVAVAAGHRGRGHAATVMAEVERVVRAAYELGALATGPHISGFYRARGWLPWEGPRYVLGPAGRTRTPDDGGIVHVLPVPDALSLRTTGSLACDWRAGAVW